VNGYDAKVQLIGRCMSDVKGFVRSHDFITRELQQQYPGKNVSLSSLLILPIQRVPRYELFLKELLKYHVKNAGRMGVCFADANSAEQAARLESLFAHESDVKRRQRSAVAAAYVKQHARLNEALTKVKTIARHINETKRAVDNMRKLSQISTRMLAAGGKPHKAFSKRVTLLEPHRTLLRWGLVVHTYASRALFGAGNDAHSRLLFLFNDILVWTSPRYAVRGHMPLSECVITRHENPLVLQLMTRVPPPTPYVLERAQDASGAAAYCLILVLETARERAGWAANIADAITKLQRARDDQVVMQAQRQRQQQQQQRQQRPPQKKNKKANK
jgi:hypothetical protein